MKIAAFPIIFLFALPACAPTVSSQGQSGGVTAGTIGTVNQYNLAPKPQLLPITPDREGITPEPTQNRDGTFDYRYVFKWTSEFPGSWRIIACGDGITSVEIITMITGHAGVRGNCAFNEMDRPDGAYRVDVLTTKKTKIVIEHDAISTL